MIVSSLRKTATKVTTCPKTTRVGNTFSGGFADIRKRDKPSSGGRTDRWEGRGVREGEGGARGCGQDFKKKKDALLNCPWQHEPS
ncbi:hypothetical protein JZ751_015653 [Albula glossodonta]|uniref:Uncharacterized protein n=1 Tax=Albula glossodonta TaxID=121402 RepID=A0A8T2P298_9TELE|nr:hypothetical protein JZ751_015653 [Albula glossodonta]